MKYVIIKWVFVLWFCLSTSYLFNKMHFTAIEIFFTDLPFCWIASMFYDIWEKMILTDKEKNK